MAGILDQVNTYFSKASGADIRTKMEGKAKRGGLPGRAPIGYLNTRETIDGREVRTVEVDPERAPLITMLFQRYASGQYGFHQLLKLVTEAGLRTRPTETYPKGRPLYLSEIGRILADRRYLGLVVWKGEEFPGRHQPLVDEATFYDVQRILAERRTGVRERKWECYLKGALWCARCGRRLILDPARSHGLPAFLAHDPGVDSGLMIAQYTQAGIVAELKRLAAPASVDTIPSSAMQEDHVSMGWHAARKLRRAVDGLARVVAIEAMTAARALDLRVATGTTAGVTTAPATGAVLALLRGAGVPGPGPDRQLSPDIETCVELIRDGAVQSPGEADIRELR
jgi:hypothetical protein